MSETLLETRRLTKHFPLKGGFFRGQTMGHVQAVDGVSFVRPPFTEVEPQRWTACHLYPDKIHTIDKGHHSPLEGPGSRA